MTIIAPPLADPQEMEKSDRLSFDGMIESLEYRDLKLSANEIFELRNFYTSGTARLADDSADFENYKDLLSFHTGELVDSIFIRKADIPKFGSFRDFLRSLCPIYPFCI
ncbi:hypothetical protein [Hufsiella ginkgonis]|uniref:Uncharacterized protein n=1 Tax=Hufsiella ginkgonis TaxID=2695274 RepID=A0A7K1XUP7_9SPHI|nr:hypothetical protein [Hufsiella ginkgonis]MXV14527.1 hypothetical protein [Hufsiella ginkgonis]